MSEAVDLYFEMSRVMGDGSVNRLILLERAANQRHFAGLLERALKPNVKLEERVARVEKVVKEMKEQADRYDPPRKT